MATYAAIRQFVRAKHGFMPMTGWVAHVKEQNGLPLRVAPNRIDPLKRVNPCPDDKRSAIEDALRHFGLI
jgi:hypothetical protein